jgi:hypothetical protein
VRKTRRVGRWLAALATLLALAAGQPASARAGASPQEAPTVVPPTIVPVGVAVAAAQDSSLAHPRLLRSQIDVYVIDGRKRRWVVSPQVFADYRFREEWVEQVSDQEMEAIGRGPDLVAGPVLRQADGHVWVVYQGSRRQVIGPDAWEPLYLSAADAVPATDEQLRPYPIGRAIGNPRRPWMVLLVMATVAVAAALCWLDQGERTRWGVRAGIVLLALASVALKLYYVTLYPWVPDGADAAAYVATARSLAATGNLLRDDPAGGLISVNSTGYPLILAVFSGATVLAHGSVVGWKVLQVGVATVLALVVGALAGQLFGARASRAALLVALLSPVWLYSAELLQYELWYALLVATGIWALARLAAARRVRWWLGLAGACYGLASLIQPKSLILLAPAVAFLAWDTVSRPCPKGRIDPVARYGRWARWGALVAFLALSLLPIAAWGARNLALHGEPLLGPTGGINLWLGNHEGATGGYMQPERPPALYERLKRYPPTLISRDARAYTDLAFAYIASHPSQVALLGLTKLERFWWTISPDRLGEFAEGRMIAFLGGMVDSPALRFAAKVMQYWGVALAAAGVLWGARLTQVRSPGAARASEGGRAGRVRQVARALLYSSFVAFWVVHVPFFAEPRYRIPVVPLLQVLEGTGIVLLVDELHARR